MQRYRFDDAEPGERDPLDNAYQSPTRQQMPPNQMYNQYPSQPQHQDERQYQYQYQDQSPQRQQEPSPARGVHHPGAHPDSSFGRLRANRRYSRDRSGSGGGGPSPYGPPAAAVGAIGGATAVSRQGERDPISPIAAAAPPQAPPHRDLDGRYWGHEIGYAPTNTHNGQSMVTPGADNFSESAAGGMAGIAYSVAERNARESGLEAMRNIGQGSNNLASPARRAYREPPPPQPSHHGYGQDQHYAGGGGYPYDPQSLAFPPNTMDRHSNSSLTPLGAAAVPPAHRSPSRSPHGFGAGDAYSDNPYQQFSRGPDPRLGVVNPNDIIDDGDEGLEYRRQGRNSMLSLHSDRSQGNNHGATAAAAGGVAAGGVLGALSGLGSHGRDASGNYGPVNNGHTTYQNGAGEYDLGGGAGAEKSEWLAKQSSGKKRWKWIIIIGAVLLVAGAIAGGVAGGIIARNNQGGGGGGGGNSGQSADDDTASNGDLNINSAEIQRLMNNKNLHRVFPGMDYTPLNTQYPDCLKWPPSQNNITRDVAVLSQLTNTIRLYGTDCNQTQMVLHAIQQLKLENDIKLWMGVWQDNNATTNARQLQQMWDILDQYTAKPFKGLIVANEILFREQMTVWQLGTLLAEVRTNLTAKGMSLPVATSDLGDKWTADLAAQSDYVMANIHPFFGGINAKDAADWTMSFWTNHNGAFFKSDKSKNIISETGWPSQGGTDCGSATVTVCPDASVAGITELNRFMEDWVCDALNNGTNYFWFEAFDEPWKISFNTPGKEWEDHWGLMDVNRNLKPGVKIPDCGGKTV